ncbi:uncharacterized protein [Littorina saxatilis]|uniref:Conodipine-M alpha chain n=1 Tax=Littorina saxatilis TaxID=31220 RepID=A0AAN9BZA0_9CAEN
MTFMLTLTLTLVSVLLTGAQPHTSSDLCTSHGSGCRAPFGLDTAYESLFRPICSVHDVCYSCGADSGLSKGDCDQALRVNMHAACAPLRDPALCRFQADNVWALQTRVVGSNFFHSPKHTAPWCIEHGITDCLPSPATTQASATAAFSGTS